MLSSERPIPAAPAPRRAKTKITQFYMGKGNALGGRLCDKDPPGPAINLEKESGPIGTVNAPIPISLTIAIGLLSDIALSNLDSQATPSPLLTHASVPTDQTSSRVKHKAGLDPVIVDTDYPEDIKSSFAHLRAEPQIVKDSVLPLNTRVLDLIGINNDLIVKLRERDPCANLYFLTQPAPPVSGL
ncbi:hypothetical protein NDU88_003676 [Pleurodeles waltl]|uniref:Uncharacterized protein n=1 Tax=Pleurodeles waltl TaxID=8319 RepID=A0AAV7QG44_PLEWA|nr:hypothetical protein NDU88_003676 [Pleurodeles waltl]